MNDTSKTAAAGKDVEDQIAVLRAEVARLTEILGDTARDRAAEIAGKARGEAEHLVRKSRELEESLETYIKEKPVQSTLIALIVGIVFGAMSRR